MLKNFCLHLAAKSIDTFASISFHSKLSAFIIVVFNINDKMINLTMNQTISIIWTIYKETFFKKVMTYSYMYISYRVFNKIL